MADQSESNHTWLIAIGSFATAFIAVVTFYQVIYDPLPDTAEGIVNQLTRIADSFENGVVKGLTPDDIPAILSSVQALALSAERAATVTPLDPDAVILRVSEGVFDLPRNEAYEIGSPMGFTIPVALPRGANSNLLRVAGKSYLVRVGDLIPLPPYAAPCVLVVVKFLRGEGEDAIRLRLDCQKKT